MGLKEAYWNDSHLPHPQSADLNPIEGIWLTSKERVRKREWRTIEELKAIVQVEWAKIDQSEVMKRTDEMPRNGKQLVEVEGKRLRSGLW